jgi:hypothetical protein
VVVLRGKALTPALKLVYANVSGQSIILPFANYWSVANSGEVMDQFLIT